MPHRTLKFESLSATPPGVSETILYRKSNVNKNRRVLPFIKSQHSCRPGSLRILDAAEPDRSGAVVTGRHQEQPSMVVAAVGLGKVPHGALMPIVASAAQDCRPREFVDILVGPLPHIANHVHDAEGAGAIGIASTSLAGSITPPLSGGGATAPSGPAAEDTQPGSRRSWECSSRKRPKEIYGRPFPARRTAIPIREEELAGPLRIRARVLDRDPRDGVLRPAFRVGSVLPILQEVKVVLGVVFSGVEDLFEGFPWILHVDADIVAANSVAAKGLKARGLSQSVTAP